MITVRQVDADDADAHRLWAAQERDLADRYGDPDLVLETEFATLVGSWIGYDDDGVPVASLVARWSPYAETRPGDLEFKRLWVEPTHRGHGHAKVMMAIGESAARRHGATRIILETGSQQPEAMALYERIGYRRMAAYGEYTDDPQSVCFARELPTRVLVINGTIGAGKTTTVAAIQDLLAERGARVASIDADWLCEASPADADDPFHHDLLMDNLAALAPVYRRRGYGLIAVARVVEEASTRGRYTVAFGSDAGPAEVSIARMEAPEVVRTTRIRARELDPAWQDWGMARTVQLQDTLEALDGDDAVVDTVGADGQARDRLDIAAEVLDAVGW